MVGGGINPTGQRDQGSGPVPGSIGGPAVEIEESLAPIFGRSSQCRIPQRHVLHRWAHRQTHKLEVQRDGCSDNVTWTHTQFITL